MPTLKGSITLGNNTIGGNISTLSSTVSGDVTVGLAKWGKIRGDVNDQLDLIELLHNIDINDLVQSDTLIINCGDSVEVM